MPSHELNQDSYLEEHGLTSRRSPLSPKAAWPAADPTEARLLAERTGAASEALRLAERSVGLAPVAAQPESPHAALLRLAKKAFPDLSLTVGMSCKVNGITGTSPWQFVLRTSGMPLGATKLEAVGENPQECIDAMIRQVAPVRRQVIADREQAMRTRHQAAA